VWGGWWSGLAPMHTFVGWPFFFLTKETFFFPVSFVLSLFCSFFVSVFLPFFLSLCLTPKLSHGHGSTSNGTYVSQKKTEETHISLRENMIMRETAQGWRILGFPIIGRLKK